MARLYGRRWNTARREFLSWSPWCVMCEQEGRMEVATVVDHKQPHRGDPVLFWDEHNWQPLCSPHHNGAKQALEKSGTIRGCDAEGIPLDPSHHWSK